MFQLTLRLFLHGERLVEFGLNLPYVELSKAFMDHDLCYNNVYLYRYTVVCKPEIISL
jgi:hypothetical protein